MRISASHVRIFIIHIVLRRETHHFLSCIRTLCASGTTVVCQDIVDSKARPDHIAGHLVGMAAEE
jgi:hypothetical protein